MKKTVKIEPSKTGGVTINDPDNGKTEIAFNEVPFLVSGLLKRGDNRGAREVWNAAFKAQEACHK
ncbi:hypothetical protein B0E33_01410 [Roseibium algicola]|uniref:Uncharacterized protein n=1 Tax=Roseibium algicola TaxID=2857014 RepID=A0ABM6HWH3_9HYPH|nr:hypothetical protein [Roseibium aggregatum]AQQ02413.1 hypothetical protein B0E33_01410 [Roseibium aggregatum]